ncbi:hypothetical protein ACPEEZ_01705 [Frigoribacterium sp. 2-23]|uniref:hypothetical protein n=1 Tax=Frigoribacterium sp. 2-23 TaxID=3415006 RepID=UPI003C6F68D7
MSEHDHPNARPAGSTPHEVPPGLAAPIAPSRRSGESFDPIALRPAVDVAAAEARLAQLGQSRSTAALGERADLLRTLGRLDEALAIAEEAFRLAHFTGDRADSTQARIRRAHVFREQGRLERALNDLHTSHITATTEEWRDLEAAAAELEGYTLFDLGRIEEARAALGDALTAYEAAGAPRERTDGLRAAIEGMMRSYLQASQPAAPEFSAPAPVIPIDLPPTESAAAGRDDAGDLSDTNEVAGPLVAPAVNPADLPAAVIDTPATTPTTRDTSLWGKISSLATNAAAGRRDHDDEDRNEDDEPARGVTGVTGRVERLPRDDEQTTWPFPRK